MSSRNNIQNNRGQAVLRKSEQQELITQGNSLLHVQFDNSAQHSFLSFSAVSFLLFLCTVLRFNFRYHPSPCALSFVLIFFLNFFFSFSLFVPLFFLPQFPFSFSLHLLFLTIYFLLISLFIVPQYTTKVQ